MVLGHGAGGGIAAPDLVVVTEAALALGFTVVLVEQPYRVAGRKSVAPTAQLDAAWIAVCSHLRTTLLVPAGAEALTARGAAAPGTPSAGAAPDAIGGAAAPRTPSPAEAPNAIGGAAAPRTSADGGPRRVAPVAGPLVVGGRSSGARVACRTAAAVGASGVLALAFPLVPPRRRVDGSSPPSRQPELDLVTVSTLVIQGESDPFGMPRGRRTGAPRRVVKLRGDHRLASDRPGLQRAVTAWLATLS